MGIVLSTAQSQGGLLTLFSPAHQKIRFTLFSCCIYNQRKLENPEFVEKIYSKSSHWTANMIIYDWFFNHRLPFKVTNVKKVETWFL